MSNAPPVASDAPDVLFVDLDGTLVAGDLLFETVFAAFKRRPWRTTVAFLRLMEGRASFKRRISEVATPDPKHLPYREEVLALLREEKARGRTIVLATAANRQWADRVAESVGLFDGVIATEAVNLKGAAKLAAIREYCRDRGIESFSYVGDGSWDVPIWKESSEVIVVGPSRGLRRAVDSLGRPVRVVGKRARRWKAAIRAMRPHQWAKNFLLFVPLLLAHLWSDAGLLLAAMIAFGAFSTAASAVYVLNDLFDVENDRQHPKKRKRPFASGELPIVWGPPLALGLIAASAACALSLPWMFSLALGVYFVLTTLYSVWLKRIAMLDVVVLANLYTLRILAGGAATGVVVSEWLMSFSTFIFISLAFAKRYAELTRLEEEKAANAAGRGYNVEDLSLIETLGPTSGYLAALVLALYINSPEVKELYHHPSWLWIACPVLLYWISRLWLLAKRKRLSEDPVVFALTDRTSLAVGGLLALLIIAASVVR